MGRESGLNEDAVSGGLVRRVYPPPFETRTFLMSFNHGVHWDKALRISAEIEDEELSRRLSMGK